MTWDYYITTVPHFTFLQTLNENSRSLCYYVWLSTDLSLFRYIIMINILNLPSRYPQVTCLESWKDIKLVKVLFYNLFSIHVGMLYKT